MVPVVTPVEMRAIDAAAPESVDVLISRAGAAVARSAIDLLGGTYGRVVHVIAGGGNNGADGRDAARRLSARGIRVNVFDAATCPAELPRADLVIDAAYGTGFRSNDGRPWRSPSVGDAVVLAVDIPSGLDALTGETGPSGVLRADRTITFQALKPGMLFAAGPRLCGRVDVADIGLDVSSASIHLVERDDVADWWPKRAVDAHKWTSAVKVIAGSIEMPGAAQLCAAAAARGGAGLVVLASPGSCPTTRSEIIRRSLPITDFAADVLVDLDRFSALVIGPGLGRASGVAEAVRTCVASAQLPVVVDGDGISAWASCPADGLPQRTHPTVVTPHDGEFEALTGERPGSDRIEATRRCAARLGGTVLLKGPTTVIAAHDSSEVWLVGHGDERLATAGTGDVLAGLIASALAGGTEASRAAAGAAWLHAEASRLGPRSGQLAGDLVDLIPQALGRLR